MRCPCQNCQDRTIYCHVHCKRYLQFVQENDALKQKLRELTKERVHARGGQWVEYK